MVERTPLHVALMIALVRLKMNVLRREYPDPMRSALIVDMPVDVIFPKARHREEGACGIDHGRCVYVFTYNRNQGRRGGDKTLVLQHQINQFGNGAASLGLATKPVVEREIN